MDAIYDRCCGLDIHKRTVVACMIVPGSGRQSRKEIRTFGTMTDDLLALADWLAAEGVTHVAMESTGVFWKPLFNVLEDRFQLLLVNARDIKQVPGRKTGQCHAHRRVRQHPGDGQLGQRRYRAASQPP